MLGDITIGQLSPVSSPVHKLDPRFKIVFTIVFVVMLFCANTLGGAVLTVLFVLLSYAISKIPFKMLIKTIKPIIPIVLFMLIFNIFFYTGKTVIFEYGFIKLSLEGIYNALFMVFRIITIIAGTSLLTYTSSSIELTDAIESLLSPLKVIKFPVHELAMMMTIALRFIPTLIDETNKIMSAQKSRGADIESGNIFARAKALMPILIPLFVSAIKRANELATAMEARCYHNGIGRTRMKKLKSSYRDIVALIFVLVFLTGVILFGVYTRHII